MTEIHKRGGMDDEEYSKVSVSEDNVSCANLHFFPLYARTEM